MINFNATGFVEKFNNIHLKKSGLPASNKKTLSFENAKFSNLLLREIQNSSQPTGTTKQDVFDLKRVEKYYSGEYWKDHPVGTFDPHRDLIRPAAHLAPSGEFYFFPPQNAPGDVKRAFFTGLENMSFENRQRIHRKIDSHYVAVTTSTAKHLGKKWYELDTEQSWDAIYGNNNSYKELFASFVYEFKVRASGASDIKEREELLKYQVAHQIMLDTLISHNIW